LLFFLVVGVVGVELRGGFRVGGRGGIRRVLRRVWGG
jgi:hypothetical protein